MRALKYILVLCLLPGWVAVRGQEVAVDELYNADRPLDEVVVEGKLMRPDDIRQILGGFFNASDFSDALQAYRVKNDKDLTSLFEDFETATTVKIVPRSYIDFSSFWFDRVREWAEEDYAEAVLGQTRFISDEIIFLPLADGTYEVQLRLTPSLLLEQEGGIGRPMLDARAEAIRRKHWDGNTFTAPKEARQPLTNGQEELLGLLEADVRGAKLADIDPAKEEYYRRAGALIQNPEYPFKEQLNTIWEVYKLFNLCIDQYWGSFRENGVVPYCFWQDQSDPRVPFLAGLVDAAYIDTEAMSHLPELIEQIRKSAIEVSYAYSIGALKCSEDKLEAGKTEYAELVRRLTVSEPSFGAWKWLEEMLTTTDSERLDELGVYFDECGEVIGYREKLTELTEFVQDWKAMLEAYLKIEGRVTAYLEVLKAGDDESWYERGFLTSQAAIAVFPVGNVSKTKKARQVVELLTDESNWVRVTDEVVTVGVSATKYGKDYISSLTGFSDDIAQLAAKEGLSIDDFLNVQNRTASSLLGTKALESINKIRNSIPSLNSNTVIQKVIHKSDIAEYLSGNYSSCKGYVSTVQDSKHLKTYEDIFLGMRLDYSGSKFSLSDGSCGVIRFKASNSSKAEIPRSTVNGGNVSDGAPFTGHGFTAAKSDRLAVPEWKMDDWFDLDDGAEIWEISSDGSEVLRAVFSKSQNKFILANK